MTYVDSDNTISDFIGWALTKDPQALDSPDDNNHWERVSKVLVNFYKEAFLESKLCSYGDFFLEQIKNNDDWMVLTSLSARDRIEKYCKNISVDKILDTHKENKYLWFEKHRISRNKIIICDNLLDKVKYCKPGDLLFDDNWNVIKAWRQSGGKTIRVGTPYDC